MGKLNIDSDLLKRIQCASVNGSKVATALLEVFRENRRNDAKEATGGKSANYFSSVRVKNAECVRIEIKYCNKDVENENFPDHGNPDAPWFEENRTRTNCTGFAKIFPAIENAAFDDMDYAYFNSAMILNSKVSISISDKMQDIENAYAETSYITFRENGDDCHTLHGSCMRYTDGTSRNVADFYRHVAGASIIVAKDEQGNVLARAMVWKDISFPDLKMTLSFIERTYFTFYFLLPMMREYAKSNGIQLRKTKNDYTSCREFTAMTDIETPEGITIHEGDRMTLHAEKVIPALKWHKKGSPYCDTMHIVTYDREQKKLLLRNDSRGQRYIAELQSTGGGASSTGYYICPMCGKVQSSDGLCEECASRKMTDTVFGRVMPGSIKTWKGYRLPSFLFNGETPNAHCQNYLSVKKLFTR